MFSVMSAVQQPIISVFRVVRVMDILRVERDKVSLSLFATCSLIKLSELQESMSAVKATSFITVGTAACDKLLGKAALIPTAHKDEE